MTIIIKPVYASQSASHTLDNFAYVNEYMRQFVAITSLPPNQSYEDTEILAATGVPRRFDPFGPDDLGALCVSVTAKHAADTDTVWNIEAKYKTQSASPGDQKENPLERPTKWRYSSVRGTRTVDKDRDGKPFLNTAGGMFRDAPEIIYSTSRYTVTRNQLGFRAEVADTVSNTVNITPWFGKSPGTVLCEGIQGDEQYEGEYHFWTVTFVFHWDRYGWRPTEVLNMGRRQLLVANGDEDEPTSASGVYDGTFVKLAEDGTALGPQDEPWYEKFNLYDEEHFEKLVI